MTWKQFALAYLVTWDALALAYVILVLVDTGILVWRSSKDDRGAGAVQPMIRRRIRVKPGPIAMSGCRPQESLSQPGETEQAEPCSKA